jgi:hypothetical protein
MLSANYIKLEDRRGKDEKNGIMRCAARLDIFISNFFSFSAKRMA